ncbi:MAG TPA: zinc ribbon domain-containing protein [Gaiellaceae bacterium]|nr:zinc ribbon domain-containing protein [Gaiellaceae bacterium]
MSLRLFVCSACGRAVFPHLLLCPDCGSTDWRREPVDGGVLEAVTDRGVVRLGAVRTSSGPLVIVRVDGDAKAGATVQLDEDGDVPVASG